MPTEVVYYVASSVDGYIATEDGGVSWLDPFQAGGEDYGFSEFHQSVDALVMGSGTYEVSVQLGPWPAPDKPSWVFTTRELSIAHPSVTLTSKPPRALMEELAGRGIQRVWLMGGGKLATAFRLEGLLTQYVISVIPVVLGCGIPLLADGAQLDTLKLSGVESYQNGIVQLTYEPTTEGPES